jgi:protein TonB
VTDARPTFRLAGWLLACASALGLIGGATAYALAGERRESILMLDLGVQPPSAPGIAAVAEAAPDVVAAEPKLSQISDPTEPVPDLPDLAPSPDLAAADTPMLPEIERPVAADVALPSMTAKPEATTKPETRPKPRPERKSEAEREPEKARETKRTGEPARTEKAATAASAPSAGAKVKSGAPSAATYAKAVLKKVRATKKQSGAGKGRVVVGFSIAPDGGLASLTVLQSSGTAQLDQVALDHIRRSAPFPAPPLDARPSYSFEFVGK